MACFADLPGDIVSIIADRAAVECRPRMRAVCSAWSAAVPIEPQPPWIVLQPQPDGDDDGDKEGERGSSFSVLSLPANRKLTPGSSVLRCLDNMFPAGSRCVGAGHGSLALVGRHLSVMLVNPVTGRSVSLPPLTRYPVFGGLQADRQILWRTAHYMFPDFGELVWVEKFVDTFVWKLFFSAKPEQDDYFAVLVAGDPVRYATYARAGATEWMTLRYDDNGEGQGSVVCMVSDVVHVAGGRFMAVQLCHECSKLLAVDLGDDGAINNGDEGESPPTSVRILSDSSWDLAFGSDPDDPYSRSPKVFVENHLVLAGGELYQIWSSWVRERRESQKLSLMLTLGTPEDVEHLRRYQYRIRDAKVVKCDPDLRPTTRSSQEEEADLGDWAVLIGRNETVALRAGDDDVPAGVKGGCLYFIDIRADEGVYAFHLRSGQQVETAAGCDGQLREAMMMAGPQWRRSPPFWFLPSLK